MRRTELWPRKSRDAKGFRLPCVFCCRSPFNKNFHWENGGNNVCVRILSEQNSVDSLSAQLGIFFLRCRQDSFVNKFKAHQCVEPRDFIVQFSINNFCTSKTSVLIEECVAHVCRPNKWMENEMTHEKCDKEKLDCRCWNWPLPSSTSSLHIKTLRFTRLLQSILHH